MMSSEYPTPDTLDAIRGACQPNDALRLVAEAWYEDYGSIGHELSAHEGYVVRAAAGARYLRLATGGWSGNEEILAALQENRVAWLRTWQLSARGGLYIFRYV